MSKIYFLQIMCNFNEKEHYENVYSTKERAIEEGKKWADKLLREQYKDMFGKDEYKDIPELTTEQLYKLNAIYDFSITEFDPDEVEKTYEIEKLPVVKEKDFDLYAGYTTNLEPIKIIHSYDYKGKEDYVSGIFIFNYKGERKEKEVMMKYKDYINQKAGTKFKKGDVVRIIENKLDRHTFCDKLYVITDVPHKKKNQKFFYNRYDVIVNHNQYDEGCHVDVCSEEELELFTGKLPKDSPIVFLSKYFKGKIKLKDISWIDIECGNIILNEHKSFRDISEIMEQLK